MGLINHTSVARLLYNSRCFSSSLINLCSSASFLTNKYFGDPQRLQYPRKEHFKTGALNRPYQRFEV